MRERRHGPLVTLLAAVFLFRIGNAVATLALPWFVLSHTGSASWAGITAASSVVATILGAWVGGGLVDRFGRAPLALISGVLGGAAALAAAGLAAGGSVVMCGGEVDGAGGMSSGGLDGSSKHSRQGEGPQACWHLITA